jgi:hypothetical protein
MKNKPPKRAIAITPVESIQQMIFIIRGQKVMIDRDLAGLYGVETRVLNQAVRRNLGRFPDDFMFRITKEEADSVRSQIVTLKSGRGKHSKYLSYAFTEQGVAMLSSVLKSGRAIAVNIMIMRAFVKLREILLTHKELAKKLALLESKTASHDVAIRNLFDAIRELMAPPPAPPRRHIGFKQ